MKKIFVLVVIFLGVQCAFALDVHMRRDFSIEYRESTVSGTAQVHLGTGHEGIMRPFIVVEGFDMVFPMFIDTGGSISDYFYTLPQIVQDQYDVIYMDLHQSNAAVQANAQFVEMLLDWVNLCKFVSRSYERNVVIGLSLGAIIVRYALCDMEREGRPHGTSLYISHDGPHFGVNIPIGIQTSFRSLYGCLYGDNRITNLSRRTLDKKLPPVVNAFYEAAHSPAAQQMFMNYITPDGVFDHSVYIDFMNELEVMGMPAGDQGHKIRNVAISNGGEIPWESDFLFKVSAEAASGLTSEAILITPPAKVLQGILIKDAGSFFASLIPGTNRMMLNLCVNPARSGELVSGVKISYVKSVLWSKSLQIRRTLFEDTAYSPEDVLPLDDEINGSWYPVDIDEGGSKRIVSLGHVGYTFEYPSPSVSLVPTASALCVGKYADLDEEVCNKDYTLPEYLANPSLAHIPFDVYYVGATLTRHMTNNDEINEFICSELEAVSGLQGPVLKESCLNCCL